jgi:hypothetical protein
LGVELFPVAEVIRVDTGECGLETAVASGNGAVVILVASDLL